MPAKVVITIDVKTDEPNNSYGAEIHYQTFSQGANEYETALAKIAVNAVQDRMSTVVREAKAEFVTVDLPKD